jgi:ankyrin repeat protein
MFALLLFAAAGVGTGREPALVDVVRSGSDVSVVRSLVKRGADVNTPAADGTTALHWAAYRDDLDTVVLLLGAGAHAKATNRYGVSPLSLAATNGNARIIERLLKAGADPKTLLPGGETPLMTAARTGKPDAVRLLLVAGADVNARESSRGQTALMWAAAQGNAAVIGLLIEAGAEVHARATGPTGRPGAPEPGEQSGRRTEFDLDGQRLDNFTPLLFAVRRGHLEAARTLLRAGANVNDTARDGSSALAVAIGNGHWELASFLLETGADPNASGPGWTPLHQLARTRNPSRGRHPAPSPSGTLTGLALAKQLIARGANVNARMTRTFRDEHRSSINFVGATPFWVAAKSDDVELTRLLLASGADPHVTVNDKTTALAAAAGVGMFYPDEDGGTPEQALQTIKLLVEAGCDVNAANNRGWTALHGAAYRAGGEVIAQYLIDHGARLDAKDNNGYTPIAIATNYYVLAILQRKPETAAVLRKAMEARGLPIEVFTAEEVRAQLEERAKNPRVRPRQQ